MKRHPKVCKILISEGFCRYGDKGAYSHTKQKPTQNQMEMDILNDKVENLEKIVQEKAKTIDLLQNELYNKKGITKYEIETNSVKCKKVITMKKHMNTKHEEKILS